MFKNAIISVLLTYIFYMRYIVVKDYILIPIEFFVIFLFVIYAEDLIIEFRKRMIYNRFMKRCGSGKKKSYI